jgi:ribosomal 30S subunit maturation factor RimM
MQAEPIEGQFYSYELVKVTVSLETDFRLGKIVRTRIKGGIKIISSEEDTTRFSTLG